MLAYAKPERRMVFMSRQRLESTVGELIELDKVVPSAEQYEVKKLLGREWKIVAGTVGLIPMWEFTRTVKLGSRGALESSANRARFNNLYIRDGINPEFHHIFNDTDGRDTAVVAAESGDNGIITISQTPEIDLLPQVSSSEISK